MIGLKGWWRRFGGLVAILLLAVVAVAPNADLLLCSGEAVPAAEAGPSAKAAPVSAASEQHADTSSQDDLGGVCAHGHCHHGGAFTPMAIAQISDGRSRVERLSVPLSAPAVSHLQFGLDRPPRV